MTDFGEGLKTMFSLAKSGDIRITKDVLPSIHQKLKSISAPKTLVKRTIIISVLSTLQIAYSPNKKDTTSITKNVNKFPIIKQIRGIFDELLKKTNDEYKTEIEKYIVDYIEIIIIFINKLKYDEKSDVVIIEKSIWVPLYDKLSERFKSHEKYNIFGYVLYNSTNKNAKYYKNYFTDLHKKNYGMGINTFNTTQFGFYKKQNFLDEMMDTFNKLDKSSKGSETNKSETKSETDKSETKSETGKSETKKPKDKNCRDPEKIRTMEFPQQKECCTSDDGKEWTPDKNIDEDDDCNYSMRCDEWQPVGWGTMGVKARQSKCATKRKIKETFDKKKEENNGNKEDNLFSGGVKKNKTKKKITKKNTNNKTKRKKKNKTNRKNQKNQKTKIKRTKNKKHVQK